MRYRSGGAFRQALETRLKERFLSEGLPLARSRKMVAFERFVARLVAAQPAGWILKGGLALQLRLGGQARTTMDIDLLNTNPHARSYETLNSLGALDLGDWFRFEVQQGDPQLQDLYGGQRFQVNCLLDGRIFESFHIDVGTGDIVIEEPDWISFEPLLAFSGIQPTIAPCYPITQQIAEKLHALTRPYTSGESTRVKDLVDILLLARSNTIDGTILSQAILATFGQRNTHPLPDQLPALPQSLKRPYLRLSQDLSLEFADLDQAQEAAARFLNPLLQHKEPGIWNVSTWDWRPNADR